jgi:hypothetical protein
VCSEDTIKPLTTGRMIDLQEEHMLTNKERGKIGRYAFATLALLLVLVVAAAGIPKSSSPGAGSDNQGIGALRPDKGTGAQGSDDNAAWAAEQAKHSPVTVLPGGGEVRTDFKHDISPPLRDIPASPPGTVKRTRDAEDSLYPVPPIPLPRDPALQTLYSPLAMPTPIANFEGQYNYSGVIPPDTNGDVGPNHYIQTVNSTFQIYNKNTGATLYGPVDINTLFRGFGGTCEAQNAGDPIVLYDQLADRWQISQFTSDPGPYFQCIAVSATSDPTAAWYRYAFQTSAVNFEDYPHLGVWPDAYYMSTNEFANGVANVGAGFFAFERNKMLVGQAARQIYFTRPVPEGGYLPSDLDGYTLPPAGSPNYFMSPLRTTGNAVREYRFQITTWDPTPVAALVGPIDIPVTPFSTSASTAPQPGTNIRLDTIPDRFMFRLAYRNFGTHEALVVNHTVDAGSGRAGVRWYEFRAPNAVAPTVFQQGTYAPNDGLWRWMGSIAQDVQGNMGLGFSASSSTLFPSIRYAGRLVTDPPGQLTQGEGSIIEGTGSQTETLAGRWGDYSSMNVDVDDCTFWYTQEYYTVSGLRNWKTRIGSFKFPGCTAPVTTPTATVTGTPPTATRTATALATATATATACAGGTSVVNSITNADPTMTGRLARDGVPSTCGTPKACPGAGDAVVRHYDPYTFVNTSSVTQCVTVNITNNCGNNALLSAAYLGSFDPSNVCTNYLADMGIAAPSFSYSFSVPPGATYVVTVLENSANVGCASYSMTVSPCGVGTPLPTVTGTPPTATPTRTATGTATRTGTATSTPCGQSTLLSEGFETGTLGAFTATTTLGSSPWTPDNTVANTGTWSAMGSDPDEISDQQLTQMNAVAIPTAASSASLRFSHRYSFEDETLPYDGGVLEYSTDDGATWVDAGTLITQGGYNGVILTGIGNPLAGRMGWVNVSPGFPAFTQVVVNLNTLRGQSVKFRFRIGSDEATGAPGWWVDDVGIVAQLGCGTGTVVPTVTTVASATVTPRPATQTPGGPTATNEPATPTLAPSATATACTISFTDVPPDNVFYPFIRCLACRGIIGGYSDGTFRPFNDITRGQIAKMVSNAAGFDEDPGPQIYEDVDGNNPFYQWINRLSMRGHMGGYPCGTVDAEPCIEPDNRPYFRPFNNATRGQLSKIVANAAGVGGTPTGQFYTDVPEDNPFYTWIMRLTEAGVMSGYECGGPGEPCDNENRPYFRPFNNVTRGQASKIVANTFYPNCETPSRR